MKSNLFLGVRLHDLPAGSIEERVHMAAALGFSCVHLASKTIYSSYKIDRSGLTYDLAMHLRELLEKYKITVAVFGCYKNLATPSNEMLTDVLAEYKACSCFAKWLEAGVVGTETGRPNVENVISDDRFSERALQRLCRNVKRASNIASEEGVRLAVEPGWNEVACTPERAATLIAEVDEPSLGVIFDPVSLLHPEVIGNEDQIVARAFKLFGNRIAVLHAKDFEIVPNENSSGWCDGSGSRLVCHAAGTTGNFDFAPVMQWAKSYGHVMPCVIENSTPQTVECSRDYLLGL